MDICDDRKLSEQHAQVALQVMVVSTRCLNQAVSLQKQLTQNSQMLQVRLYGCLGPQGILKPRTRRQTVKQSGAGRQFISQPNWVLAVSIGIHPEGFVTDYFFHLFNQSAPLWFYAPMAVQVLLQFYALIRLSKFVRLQVCSFVVFS